MDQNPQSELIPLQKQPQPQSSAPVLTIDEINAIKGRPPTAVAKQVKAATIAKKLELTQHNKQEVIRERDKLDLFLESYLKTGNATQTAMDVFGTKSRTAASALGSYYLNKARDLGRIIMEEKGVSFGSLVEKASKRMDDPKSTDFVALFDRLMKLGGHADFLVKQNVNKSTVNVVTMQKDLFDEYVEGEYVETEEEKEDE